MYISKSSYVSACQCKKALWLKKYRRELAEVDAMTQARFDIGTAVGEVARGLFPDGVQIAFDFDPAIMAERTQALLAQGQSVIYEAAFIYQNLVAICDILVKGPAGFAVYEVKSSTEVGEPHLVDTAFQYYVLTGAGLAITSINVVHINTQYVRQGQLDLSQLFRCEDVTRIVWERQGQIDGFLPDLWEILGQADEPGIDIGPYCSTPYSCVFMHYCWRHIPPVSVFNLHKMQSDKKFACYYNQIVTYDDLVQHQVGLSPIQTMQVEAALHDQTFINSSAIRNFIHSLRYPLYFLDFETFQQAIPEIDGIRPYEQVPFQYSLHAFAHEAAPLQHQEFLGQEGTDPRRALAEQLVSDIPPDACTLAYHATFEKGVISQLATSFPDLAVRLMKIRENIVDLEIPFKSGFYYVKAMGGSFSIKSILPALFPDDLSLDYHSLAIQNGVMANQAFASLHLRTPEAIASWRQSLLEYCKLDTLAMVRIWEKLRAV
jgi:hypothetical protein